MSVGIGNPSGLPASLDIPDVIDGVRWYSGRTAGVSRKIPEDPAKCVVEVCDYSTRWPRYHQCDRKRGHGPEGLFCKQHSPEKVNERKAKAEKAYQDLRLKNKFGYSGMVLVAALKDIENGHNDPRARAREALISVGLMPDPDAEGKD